MRSASAPCWFLDASVSGADSAPVCVRDRTSEPLPGGVESLPESTPALPEHERSLATRTGPDNLGGSADWCKPDHTDDDTHPSQCSGNSKASAWRSAQNSDRARSRTAGIPAFLAAKKGRPCAAANDAYSSPTAPA